MKKMKDILFEMPLKDGNGCITYSAKTHEIFIENNTDRVKIPINELIRFAETNFFKRYLNKEW